MTNLYDELHDMFVERGYVWKIDGEYRIPTVAELQQAIDSAVGTLYSESEGSLIEVGRLIISKGGSDTYDVYLHIGEIT